MTTLDESEETIKDWINLKCPHCGKLNPADTLKCIYCSHLIRVKAGPGHEQEQTEGGQNEQGTN